MSAITLMKTPAETALVQAFESAKARLPGDVESRARAFEIFNRNGLPHRRVEEFKYTDLRALMQVAAPAAVALSPDAARVALTEARAFAGIDVFRIPFVNGYLVETALAFDRLPEGIDIVPLAGALASGHDWLSRLSPVHWARENPIYQLNSAFMADGVVIRVTAQATSPVHLQFVTAGTDAVAMATRVLVIVEPEATLTLVESHESRDGAAHQSNDVVELIAADGAHVRHVRLNAEGDEVMALSTLAVKLGAESSFNSINVVTGSAVSRHQVFALFSGENSTAQINGATMLNGRQHSDSTLIVEHGAPHCESRELFKTVIDDDATGVFQGKIIVPPHAQKTDGRMMSAALLLSEGGAMNNKPELEIFADDVQCGHGATCGQLDEDLLFYLMARGLPKVDAESLLIQAFLGEAVEFVENESLRDALIAYVEGWLAARD